MKEKLELVQALGDIEIASRLLEGERDSGVAEVDRNYKKLNCSIVPINQYVYLLISGNSKKIIE